MEVNSSYTRREYGGGAPVICTDDFGRSRTSKLSPPLSSSVAMSIPGSANPYGDVPPPLPPPRYPSVDGLPDRDAREFRRAESDDTFAEDTRQHYKMRDTPFSYLGPDEGYHSIGSARHLNSPPFSMHHTYRSAPNSGIDSSMLSKLNSKWPGLSSSAGERRPARPSPVELPKLHSLPVRPRHLPQPPLLDSPHRYTQTPILSEGSSPHGNPFSRPFGDYRSPAATDPGDPERSPDPRSTRTNSGSQPDDSTISTQGSYDVREDDMEFTVGTSQLGRLNIEDAIRERERERGQKRRASSPPSDDAPLPSDLLFRRDGAAGVSRGSPTPRLTPITQSSISSASSAGLSAGSYRGLTTASSMTSMGSFGRRSPPGRSPVSPNEASGYESPFAAHGGFSAVSRNSSMGFSAALQPPHQGTLNDFVPAGQGTRTLVSPRKLTDPPKTNTNSIAAKMQGFYMCECCPKKPKKFETREELSAHEAEKQYECSFCGNRFKNKNEAERHQNSLHVRRHSWSCSALTTYERAFHESTTRPGEADTCGYCGEEFTRTGLHPLPNQGRYASDEDWEVRIRHLQDLHKFRECNSSKKFYRADHFRQHLKHSHAGTSGKWTNMLENACMMDEEPPLGPR